MPKRVATYYLKTRNKDGEEVRKNVSPGVFFAVVATVVVVLIVAIVLTVKVIGAVLGFIGIPMWMFWVPLIIWFIANIKLSFNTGEDMKLYRFIGHAVRGDL